MPCSNILVVNTSLVFPAGINLSLSFVSPYYFLHIYNSALLFVHYFTYLGLFSPTVSTTIHCKIWQVAKILKNTSRLLTEGNSLNYYRREGEGWHVYDFYPSSLILEVLMKILFSLIYFESSLSNQGLPTHGACTNSVQFLILAHLDFPRCYSVTEFAFSLLPFYHFLWFPKHTYHWDKLKVIFL